jgi:formyl-CoA transferase
MMESLVPEYEAYGVTRERTGGRIEGIAPSDAYRCAGGRSVVIAGNGDGIFPRLMRVVGRADLADRADLAGSPARWAARDELDAAITAWTEPRQVDAVLEALAEAGVPAGPIYSAADIASDAQFLARGMIQKRDVSTGERVLRGVSFPGIVPQLGEAPRQVRTLGPELGEHTADVLGGLLGRTPAEIAEFIETTEGAVHA